MALLTTLRRLQLYRIHPKIIFTSQLISFSPHQFTSSRLQLPPAIHFLCRAFHQTAFRPTKHNPYFNSDYQFINFNEQSNKIGEDNQLGCNEILERVQKTKDFASGDAAIEFLDNSGVKPNKSVIFYLIWNLREEWKLAFLVFRWGEKWDCVVENTWCLMIWVLGNHKKFGTAWTIIHEIYNDSRNTQQAMMIMIDRYAAANHVDKAIQTFHTMQKFKFSPDQKTYITFLKILCAHGNIEEAEEFMFVNIKFFPLETETFNVILNAWCNTAVDIIEAKRVWREMSNSCILPNGTSYTHLISCYSSVGNLFESLRLYDEMKKRGWTPGVEVYHSLIYVLTRENCLSEALKIVDNMKEMCLNPNSTTYNCIIRPLCEAGKFQEAKSVLVRMIGEGIGPTVDMYHSLLEGESVEKSLEILDHMRNVDLGSNKETFLRVIGKFLKLGQPENALKIWLEMKRFDVRPDHACYVVLVEGLVKCGLVAKARELYSEMTSVGLVDDPSMKKLLEEPIRDGNRPRKGEAQMAIIRCIKKGKGLRCGTKNVVRRRRSLKRLEKNRAGGT